MRHVLEACAWPWWCVAHVLTTATSSDALQAEQPRKRVDALGNRAEVAAPQLRTLSAVHRYVALALKAAVVLNGVERRREHRPGKLVDVDRAAAVSVEAVEELRHPVIADVDPHLEDHVLELVERELAVARAVEVVEERGHIC